MAGTYGADVAQLRELARSFQAASDSLRHAKDRVGGGIRITAWVGPWAVTFRSAWDNDHSRAVQSASEGLEAAARSLRTEAEQQEKASAVDSGAGDSRAAAPGTGHLRPSSTAPAANAEWWSKLSEQQRQAEIEKDPQKIGSTDGIPAAYRDQANRIVLSQTKRELWLKLVGLSNGLPEYVAIGKKLLAIYNIEKALKSFDKEDGGMLLLFDASQEPVLASVALGDPDRADHIAVLTSGMWSSPDKGMYTDEILNMQRSAEDMLYAKRQSGSVSTIVWFGYENPGLVEVVSDRNAQEGAHRLAQFGDGLAAVNDRAHITAVGHSYGSLVTGLASQKTDSFDSALFIGSPGIGASNASALKIDSGQGFVLENRWDPVADLAAFGSDPNQMSGLNRLSTGRSAEGEASSQHNFSRYAAESSTANHNIAAVITGNSGSVVTGVNIGVGESVRAQAEIISVATATATSISGPGRQLLPMLQGFR